MLAAICLTHVAVVRFVSTANANAIVVKRLAKKLYKKINFFTKNPAVCVLCHDYYIQSTVLGSGQHADCGTVPERENHLAVPPSA